MREWLLEFRLILENSKKTQWAIFLGVFGFIAIHLFANYQLSNFQLQGPMSGLTDAIRENLFNRYEKVAWGCLITFWLLAIKLYRRDKKRLYGW
jgi:hypothetical protein